MAVEEQVEKFLSAIEKLDDYLYKGEERQKKRVKEVSKHMKELRKRLKKIRKIDRKELKDAFKLAKMRKQAQSHFKRHNYKELEKISKKMHKAHEKTRKRLLTIEKFLYRLETELMRDLSFAKEFPAQLQLFIKELNTMFNEVRQVVGLETRQLKTS